MKKYTQEDFDAFGVDKDGYRICPSGDYSGVKSFGEWCSFGEGCGFGEECRFCEGCLVENGKRLLDFLKFEGFGSEKRCTYFFLVDDRKIYVRCGCFAGYLDGFRKKVVERHGNSKLAQGYLKIADLAQWQFLEEDENGR